jgi:hypothetical protein
MAHTLNIVHGSTTVSLTSSGVVFCDYVPTAGRRSQETVTEQIKLVFTGAITTIQATIRSVERAFGVAERRYDTGRGDRCYLVFQPDGAAAAYRAEIVRPEPETSAGDVVLPDGLVAYQLGGQNVLVTIDFTRKNYWEASTETELELSNPGGSGTGGQTVYNFYDTGLGAIQDYVNIAAAQIGGDLPAACRIEITNTDAGDALETVWIGQNVLSDPANLTYYLEISASDTGVNAADATCSAGFKRSYDITTTEAKVTGWTITSANLVDFNGGYFKTMIRFATGANAADVKWRIKILYSGTVIWEGGQIQFDDTYAAIARCVRELDTVQLPPYVPENSAPTDLTFELWGQAATGSTETVLIDCLVLLALDGYRRLRSLEGIVQNAVLIDDGVTGTYYQEVSSKQVRDISTVGDQIMLWPNEVNRLYFKLHSITANTGEDDRTASVKIYYRPRRITL